ncbi:MAG: pyruvate, water dikinase regulatory protein [Nitrospirota bacterium]
MSEREYMVFVVSDATGETVERVTRAALQQFPGRRVALERVANVRTAEGIRDVARRAREEGGMIVHTIVSMELREEISREAAAAGVPAVDVIGSLLFGLSEYLETVPGGVPGLLHRVNSSYFRWIEAIEFTVQHDDGRNTATLGSADVVLVGVSRTSKTPLSIYLANQAGLKVGNVPIVRGIEPPAMLDTIDPSRVYALMIEPVRLADLRRERLDRFGRSGLGGYADAESIDGDLAHYEDVLRKHGGWTRLDVTRKAVEEVASEILTVHRHRHPAKSGLPAFPGR